MPDAATLPDPDAGAPRHGSSPPEAYRFRAGTMVDDRYLILQPLGRGGMSEVMLARDTQLSRDVAIKFLLTDVASEEGRVRMLREAQAMARLSHANVASIFDVGSHENNVYLAMEYVDGETLRDWLRTPRSRRDVLAVMKQAGRGLAAAHAAGIVHRDFKPSNVAIAKDGRVCVLDFGIARAATGDAAATVGGSTSVSASATASAPAPGAHLPLPVEPETLVQSEPQPASTPQHSVTAPVPSGVLLDSPLTAYGTIVGTPGYFAPETFFSQVANARSDIFSFCVTLWRALTGKMPYSCASISGYLHATGGAGAAAPKPHRALPRWLYEAVVRGLQPDPSRRYSTMDELLRALDADPLRRRIAAGGVLLGVVVAAGVAFGVARHDEALRAGCVAEGRALPLEWDAPRRDAVKAAMLTAGDSFAPLRADRTLRALDEFALAWSREQQSACEATLVQKTQTATAYEHRSACLLGARQHFEVTVEQLSTHDPALQRRALDIIQFVSPPRQCSAREADNAFVPLPADPAARAQAQEARRLLARAEVTLDQDACLALSEQALPLTRASGVGADEARALYLKAQSLSNNGEYAAASDVFLDAFLVADRSGADRVAGLSAAFRGHALLGLGRVDEARPWIDVARAKVTRLGGDADVEARIHIVSARLEDALGNSARAVEEGTKVIAHDVETYGPDAVDTCAQVANRGMYSLNGGDVTAAAADLRRGKECHAAATSPDDPQIAFIDAILADALLRAGQLEDARAAAADGLRLRAAEGPNDPVRAVLLGHLATLEDEEEHFVEAEARARSGLAVAAEKSWTDHKLTNLLAALGFARLAQGDAAEAREVCGRGADMLERHAHPTPDTLYRGDVLRCLGEAELALHDVPRAREHLERSVSLTRRWHVDDLPRARLALADALATGAGADVSRAAQLAEQARDDLRAAAQAQPWLRPAVASADQEVARLTALARP
jgi:serine/threonine protein kinase/tetratricopeptide (TPR) repeat protein